MKKCFVKSLALALVSGILVLQTPFKAYAENSDEREVKYYQVFEDTTRFRSGGTNKLDNIRCKSREDTEEMEELLKNGGYVLVNTDDKEISDEDFEVLFENRDLFTFSNYLDKEQEYYWTMGKVYLYRPVYDDVIKELRTMGKLGMVTTCEVTGSTVIANYAEWYNSERVGQYLTEFNNNIPSWYETGFLKITTPIDMEITLELMTESTFYKLYVRAEKPLLIRMKTGGYIVREINAQGLKWDESALVYDNNIQVQPYCTEDSPYELSVEQVVEKYNIQPINIDDKPDYSWGFTPLEDIPEETVVVEEDKPTESEKKPKTQTFWRIVFVGSGLGITLLLVILFKIIRKRNQ